MNRQAWEDEQIFRDFIMMKSAGLLSNETLFGFLGLSPDQLQEEPEAETPSPKLNDLVEWDW